MPYEAKSHLEARKSVCVVCVKKANAGRVLSVFQRVSLEQKYGVNLDVCDERVPTVVCNGCRIKIAQNSSCLPQKLYDFSTIQLPPATRAQSECACVCLLCKIARAKSGHPLGRAYFQNGVGRPGPAPVKSPSSQRRCDQLRRKELKIQRLRNRLSL